MSVSRYKQASSNGTVCEFEWVMGHMLSYLLEMVIGGWFGASEPKNDTQRKVRRFMIVAILLFGLVMLFFYP